MAKYVGKIFKVNNQKLNIRGKGYHFVHVKWYNPVTRKFRCRVITSLEKEQKLVGSEREILKNTPYFSKRDDTFALFSKSKYKKLREGKIEPIPTTKTQGFDVWGGYYETRFLSRKVLRGKEQKDMHIRK